MRVHAALLPVALALVWLLGAELAGAYIAALVLHEAAHTLAASAIGLTVYSLEVLPFGCKLSFSGFSSATRGGSAVVAAAGPIANMLAAAATLLLPEGSLTSFREANIFLAAINLLPALPLDGGRICADVLAAGIGERRAEVAVGISGIAAGALLLAAGALLMAREGAFNPTLFTMGGFLAISAAGGIRTASESFMRETTDKRRRLSARRAAPVCAIAAQQTRPAAELLRELDGRRYNLIYVLDSKMNIIATLSETQLLDGIMRYGSDATIGRLCR